MSILKRYNNLFMRELMRVEFKFYTRKNVVTKNLISFLNDDNDCLFCDIFSLLFISRNKRRVIE